MSRDPVDMLPARILVVDDERQIHTSLRLRLGRDCDLVFCLSARDALETIGRERFDLCLVDIHMPQMDGLAFIDAARKVDAGLGYVVVSAFDSDENLRRTIPLQVLDFLSKPLPDRAGFEARIPLWVDETRQRRREHDLAQHATTVASDRDVARIERDVELVASESVRDALLQVAGLLTTVHAHLVTATSLVASRAKADPGMAHVQRNLEEGRKTAEAAMTAADGFFDSAFGSRDASPAFFNDGVRHAIGIAARTSRADQNNKAVDFRPLDLHLSIRGLSGIEFLLMVVPALGVALALAGTNSTVGVHGEHCPRLDSVVRDPRFTSFLWLNRRNALASRAGVFLVVTASAPPLARAQIESWLTGEYAPLSTLTARGLLAGVQKCHGLLGFSLPPQTDQFRVVLALPT